MLYEIIEKLRATTSRLEKEQILKDNQYTEGLEGILRASYNQLVNYGIIEFKEVKEGLHTLDSRLGELFILLERLKSRSITGHNAKNQIENFAKELNKEGQEILRCILKKDLRIGAQLKTIQKVFNHQDFSEFKIMLCQDFDKFKYKMTFPALAQIKFDAARVIVIVQGDEVSYRTRNGKLYNIDNLELDQEFLRLRDIIGIDDYAFDGELFQRDPKTNNPKSRQASNGVSTKLIRGTASREEQKSVGIVLWDALPLESFLMDNYEVTYQERYRALHGAHEELRADKTGAVSIALNFTVNNEDEVMTLSQSLIDAGEEGIIIKSPDNVYRKKRVQDILKVKEVQEIDLLVIGLEPGTGKYSGKIGALVCTDKTKTLNVQVGTGLTDHDRETLTGCLGKIVAVRYNTIIDNSDRTGKTLFLPRFVEIREDKDPDEVDSI